MKIHDGGIRGGHSFAAKKPTRRICAGCGGMFVGLKPLCGLCDRKVIHLPTRREPNDEPPPRAA